LAYGFFFGLVIVMMGCRATACGETVQVQVNNLNNLNKKKKTSAIYPLRSLNKGKATSLDWYNRIGWDFRNQAFVVILLPDLAWASHAHKCNEP
jgi:hypothetical protein